MIIVLVILVVLALIYVSLPLWAKLIFLVINSIFPDPIPILDEVFMIVSVINDIRKILMVQKIIEWIKEHKVLAVCIGIVVVVLAAYFINWVLQ